LLNSSATTDLKGKAMLGVYFTAKMEDDRVIKTYLDRAIKEYAYKNKIVLESITLPKYVYYNNKSNRFCILYENLESYNKFIDECIIVMESCEKLPK